jgi:hypothetical protein
MDSPRDQHNPEAFPSPAELGMSDAVEAGDVEAAIVLEMYPRDKFRALREGRMSIEDFAADLLRDVDAGIARRVQLGGP